jgi:hypothetical protein
VLIISKEGKSQENEHIGRWSRTRSEGTTRRNDNYRASEWRGSKVNWKDKEQHKVENGL